MKSSMKSIITKQWYLVLLVAVLTVITEYNLHNFLLWKFSKPIDFYLYSMILILSALLFYMIIINHIRLALMVRIWSLINIVINLFAIIYMIYLINTEFQSLKFITTYSKTILFFKLILCIVLFIGSKKYILLPKENTENISS